MKDEELDELIARYDQQLFVMGDLEESITKEAVGGGLNEIERAGLSKIFRRHLRAACRFEQALFGKTNGEPSAPGGE